MQKLYSIIALLLPTLAFAQQAPTDAPPAPMQEADNVISIFSDAYTDVPVNTYRADFGAAEFTRETIAGNEVLRYGNLSFTGIEMTGENAIDLMEAGITTLHFDFWSPNSTAFQIKMVDFGGDGYEPQENNTESELRRFLPNGEWVSVDLPLGLFAGMNMTDISQIIISSAPAEESIVYLDNLYFYSGGESLGETPLDLPVTFEDEDVTYGLSDFEGASSQVVEDPTNAENTVAQTTKIVGAQTYAGTTITLDRGGSPFDPGFASPIPFTADSTTVSVRVWSPTAGTPVRLKVEASNDNTISVETETNTVVAEAWDTLVFDFAMEATGTAALNLGSMYNKMSIFFDFGSQPEEAATYYWDDVYFGGQATEMEEEEEGPQMAAPAPIHEGDDIISLFSDAYTDVPVNTWRAEWSESGFMEDTIMGNAVKFYPDLGYAGIEMLGDSALDLSMMNTFHIDYWTENLDTLLIKLVDFGDDGPGEGNDTEFEIPYQVTEKGEWVRLDIALSDFTGINLTDISQLIISARPYRTESVYIDNVYFYNSTTVPTSEPEVGVLAAFPNPTSESVTITAPVRMERLLLFDATGRVVREFTPATDRFELPMADLRAGTYVALVTTADGQLTVKLSKR
ncbi:T9SS type A sorting domain-containing protein [Lewinella sp. IMCC34191]|uniref:T9SS type A sorting domain-containing protein n=1 Tax=Lewinella sp. IMCC34191 TaxID=2259172 RepID=UPI000E223B5C|nr:T9SS type A sorting domain-containing protein [Lewinella sp. IMCC34191]